MQKLVILFILLIPLTAFPQKTFHSVDFKRIDQRPVRRFLKDLDRAGLSYFLELRPECYSIEEANSFNLQIDTTIIPASLDSVWESMLHINPNQQYSGRMVRFGLIYSKSADSLFYPGDSYSGLAVGSIVFVNLRMLYGIKKLAVGLELTDINEEERSIRYCYLLCGKSHGSQEIKLIKLGNNTTQLTQTTHFKSDSRLRDLIYPHFHSLMVKELHYNLKNWVLGTQ